VHISANSCTQTDRQTDTHKMTDRLTNLIISSNLLCSIGGDNNMLDNIFLMSLTTSCVFLKVGQ